MGKWPGIALLLTILLPAHAAWAEVPRPERLLLLVFDQMRPDYIDRFQLKHFQKLRAQATNYPNAIVGHLGAETVVSHLVLSTGRLPKDLPWMDEVLCDKAGTLGAANAFYATGALAPEQLLQLMRTLPKETLLPFLVKQRRPGFVAAVGEKDYATLVFGTPAADAVVSLHKSHGICTPDGIAVPRYIATSDRFTLECSNAYGTERSFYPIDGARFVPGDDPAHLGGDVWVTDVALQLMDHEDWSALFLTFGGIDKIGHLTGEADGPMPLDFEPKYHLEDALRTADAQLGRLLAELERRGLRDKTLVVVTADHGGQSDRRYLGMGRSGKAMAGHGAEGETLAPWLRHLREAGNVAATFQDSAIRVWLTDMAPVNVAAVLGALRAISGVTEIHALAQEDAGWRYRRVYAALAQEPAAFRSWAAAHSEALVGTMANPAGPTFIALLADGVGFDLLGDHGGAQEHVQRIPLMLLDPSRKPQTIRAFVGLSQVRDIILAALACGRAAGCP